MPDQTQIISVSYILAVGHGNTTSDNVTPITLREGNNYNHTQSPGFAFKVDGPNNTDPSDPALFNPANITKVEFRYANQNSGFGSGGLGGNAPHADGRIMVVPTSYYPTVGATRPNLTYDTYEATAVNDQPLTDLFATWPTDNNAYTPWYEVDDGTDMRAAIASVSTWNDETDDAGGATAYVTVVMKLGWPNGGRWANVYGLNTGYLPELRITYAAIVPLSSTYAGTYNLSGEGVYSPNLVGSPEMFGRWHGDQPELLPKEAVVPKQTGGSGDLPITSLESAQNPNGQAWAIWANGGPQPTTTKGRLSAALRDTIPTGGNGRPNDNYSLMMEQYTSSKGYFVYDTSHWRSKSGSLKTASGRWTQRFAALPTAGDYPSQGICAYLNGERVWAVEYYPWEITLTQSNKVRVAQWADDPTTASAWSAARYTTFWCRWEFQVSNDVSGEELKFRLWRDTNLTDTPDEEIPLACSNVEFDELWFGANAVNSNNAHVYYNDIEFWDDYYCGGLWRDETKKGELYSFKDWTEYEYDGADWNPIDFYGEVTQVEPLVIDTNYDFDPLRDYDSDRWVYDGDTTADPLIWTKHDAQNYGFGGKHIMDIYVPTTPVPPGGRKTFVYLHGGFFVTGTEDQIPQGIITELILKEYVVVSLQVILSDFTHITNFVMSQPGQTYPAWNANGNTARHPTQILDYKMAVAWLQELTQKQTYGLTGEVITGGHSAGGYPALMAMLSKDITELDDGANQSYRVQDYNGLYGYPVIDDPDILGCYVWSAPTDLQKLIDNDVTDPDYPYLGTGQYTAETTAQIYWGMNLNVFPTALQLEKASCSNMTAIQSLGNLKPIAYSGGSTDNLVPAIDNVGNEGQSTTLKAAYSARGLSSIYYELLQSECQHYQSPYRFDPQHLEAFLNSL